MDIVWLVLTYVRATKQKDFDLHLSSLYELYPLFFACNHYNYVRYIPAYMITMLNLPATHPRAEDLLKRNGFSVSRSSHPSSRNPVYKTIEQTINHHAKPHGGIIGFSRNCAAYHRWCTTPHSRANYVEATYNVADMSSNKSSAHKELRPSQMKTSESNVKKVVDAICGFTNPFEVENRDELYCLSSGIPANSTVSDNLLQATDLGKKAMEQFIKERLVDRTKKFHDPVTRMKLLLKNDSK